MRHPTIRPRRRHLGLLAAALLAGNAMAARDETAGQRLLRQLRRQHPGTRFTSVRRSPLPGIYEVRMEANIAYVAAVAPQYFLFGRLIDTRTLASVDAAAMADPVAARPAPASPIAFDALPLEDAIAVRRGEGRRRVVVFSDPECPYCRQLETALDQLDDVTVHVFALPFLGRAMPIALWCAPDRARAWTRWMTRGEREGLSIDAACAHPIDRNLQLARRLAVTGTPTLFWPDGSRDAGLMGAAELAQRLAATQGLPQ